MLSEFPNEQVEKVVETYGLPKFTPNTITDFSVLRKQLDIIKLRGFATENGERTIGTKCVGIPVKSNSGKLLGALSIAGPSIRMPDDRVDEFVGLLSNASMILSENETIFPTCSPYPIEV